MIAIVIINTRAVGDICADMLSSMCVHVRVHCFVAVVRILRFSANSDEPQRMFVEFVGGALRCTAEITEHASQKLKLLCQLRLSLSVKEHGG